MRGIVAAALVASAGCSTPSHPPLQDPTLDGGGHEHIFDAALADVVEDTTGQCNDLRAVSQRADVEFVGAGNAPSPSGGTPADGTYTMVTYRIYGTNANGGTGPTGAWFKEAIRLRAQVVDLVDETDSTPRIRRSGTWSIDPVTPNTIRFHFDCPDVIDEGFGYTAASGALTIFFGSATGAPAVAVYPRTP
jgi:hypothetical protein